MTRTERLRYERLVRVREFGKTHHDRFQESSSASEAFAIVANVIERIDAATTAAQVELHEGRQLKAVRRAAILRLMTSISRTSKGVRTAEGARLSLSMPKRRSDVSVVQAARRFLRQAEPRQEQFIKLGLPRTCLTELREATDAFEAALAERASGRSSLAGSRGAVKQALSEGADAVKTLNIVVPNAAGDDAALAAAWERDRRLVTWEGKKADPTSAPAVTPLPKAS